eukprot:scaffold8374_cov175-Amphora_coffeaeformis.AAC.2
MCASTRNMDTKSREQDRNLPDNITGARGRFISHAEVWPYIRFSIGFAARNFENADNFRANRATSTPIVFVVSSFSLFWKKENTATTGVVTGTPST